MTVCIMNCNDNSYRKLYENIDIPENAELLAQLAMGNKRHDEIIFILPGYNRGIEGKKEEYEKALDLAIKYKSDRQNKVIKGDNNNIDSIKEKLHRLINTL